MLYFALFLNIALFAGAFLLSYSLFLPSLKIAKAVGAIDLPSDRKVHTKATARTGGFAFFAAFTAFLPLLHIDLNFKIALFAGVCTIFSIGFLDDVLSLPPFAKLTGQFAAVAVYFFIGRINASNTSVAGAIFGLLTVFWIVFICNAINLSDGLDGLAGGLSSVSALTLALIALILENHDIFWVALLLLCVLLGFLPRNVHPAKIFMGDGGALFLGFILGALASKLFFESDRLKLFCAIALTFRIPSADTVQSFVRRLIKGKNPFKADKGHFHHRLLARGFTAECATLLLITLSLVFSLGAILICI
ncbi:MAG: glycosyltransferase family 4 protein [Eubacteriales bacterium]